MVEMANRRLDIRRERVGLAEDGLRGATGGPKDVMEAVGRLGEVEGRFKAWEGSMKASSAVGVADGEGLEGVGKADGSGEGTGIGVEAKKPKAEKGEARVTAKQARQERNREKEKERKTFKEGMLVHRTEAEVKAHTSYLVFAVLPVEWSEEEERVAEGKWPDEGVVVESGKGKGKGQGQGKGKGQGKGQVQGKGK